MQNSQDTGERYFGTVDNAPESNVMRANERPITQTRLFQSGGRNDVYNFIKERSISRSPS